MKLNIANDFSGKGKRTIDTDKMNDVHAAVVEKAEELKRLCEEYNVNIGLILEADQHQVLSFFRVVGKPQRIVDFWRGTENGIAGFTKGTVRLVFVPNENR